MFNNSNNFLTTILIVVITWTIGYYKINNLEKDLLSAIKQHSVHPIYGNYVKCEDGKTCHPWEYCGNDKN